MKKSTKATKIIERKMHQIDATDKIAGRLATQIAILLMGKHKPSYRPHLDQGDSILVENVSKLKFSGKKLRQKNYYQPSTYPGGLKTIPLHKLFASRPNLVLKKMVYRMLPKNKLREAMIKRLTFKV